jgi:hypothetical protein
MAKTLSQFTISSEGEGYILHVETDDGETLDVSATYEQLDLISEAIDERLDEDEETSSRSKGRNSQTRKGRSIAAPALLKRDGGSDLEVHPAHSAAAAAHRHCGLVFRQLGHGGFRRDEQAGDRGRVLERGATTLVGSITPA